ncbi:MAG: hypothetical protein Q9163_000035 [Psora crenata]
MEVFGTLYCAKFSKPSERILEPICGPAVWSVRCDQHLKKLGYHNASFTGLDIAPLAPDLRRYGVNWRFVQHDLRKPPMPFGEAEFDLIIVNDGTTVMGTARDMETNPITALKKYCGLAASLRCRDRIISFGVFNPSQQQLLQAEKTATYIVGPASPFAKAQNPYLADYNDWVEKAFGKSGITVTPCAVMGFGLSAEALDYEEVSSRRFAIPFSAVHWGNNVETESLTNRPNLESPPGNGKRLGKGKDRRKHAVPLREHRPLNPDQAALRRTALTVAVGLTKSLEPVLMKESGKKQDEWDRWWEERVGVQSPTPPAKALVLFCHGFSDHINRFEVLFDVLAGRGIQVYGFDQRGWGRSVTRQSERGLTGPTVTVMNDITSILQLLIPQAKEKSIPLFLMGHSMGGAELLYYAATGPAEVRKEIRGYLALAPYVALHPASQPSRALVIAGRLARLVFPKKQMLQKLKPELLCRDPEIGKSWEEDELCHNIGTLDGMGGMLDRGDELDRDAVVVKEGSFFVAHGTNDLVTSYDASKRWFERLRVEDKEFKSYEGWYHVLHSEPGQDKITYANDLADWILARTGSKGGDDNPEGKSKL